MSDVVIAATPDNAPAAKRLAAGMNVDTAPIELSLFPDGETKIRATKAAEKTILYHALDHPNEKLVTLVLAASALRDLGAAEIILVAPYLCYMRQDCAFRAGEAVAQRVVAKLLSQWVDHIVTIEPHLHRVSDLASVFPEIKTTSLSAAPLLASLIEGDGVERAIVLVGPDEEARAWTKAVASKAKAPFAVMTKIRYGDRKVDIKYEDTQQLAGKHVYLVDDIVSSGATLAAAATLARELGATAVEALTVHALCSEDDVMRIHASGVQRLRSVDTIPHETNAISAAPLLAAALANECAR